MNWSMRLVRRCDAPTAVPTALTGVRRDEVDERFRSGRGISGLNMGGEVMVETHLAEPWI